MDFHVDASLIPLTSMETSLCDVRGFGDTFPIKRVSLFTLGEI